MGEMHWTKEEMNKIEKKMKNESVNMLAVKEQGR